ncbi:hypothetical protein G7062_09815 [Erysipelothrix sp. HDW6C]|uniref:hypothetical protein n=1 Tax=Erysipelothrix sp. HDW6C TaxID=2714930 RepID=UPI00140799DA|nr:hypothetical protein [Erysipelothrix sp. HDW6C]QIK70580.1 hypothetical protein G7062_09815 [Erysipelothrix sp. HDW6C]
MNLNIKLINSVTKAFTSRVTSYVITSCESLSTEYIRNGLLIPNNENKIRNVLLEDFLDHEDHRRKHKMKDYRFEPETQENYDSEIMDYKGRADIRVKLKRDFSKNDAYYIIECKRLDGKKQLNKEFVKEGINRFTNGKYSSYYHQSTVLGFVVSQSRNLGSIYNEIIEIQKLEGIESKQIQIKNKDNYLNAIRYLDKQKLKLNYILYDFSTII